MKIIDKLSYAFSKSMCYQLRKENDIEIIKYGIEILIRSSIKVFSLLIIGILLNNLSLLIITTVSFILLRLSSGGFHFNSYKYCYFVSLGLLTVLSLIANEITQVSLNWNLILVGINFITIIILVIFKPLINPNRPYVGQKHIYLKISIIISIVSLLISLSIKENFLSYSIAIQLAMLFQSLTLIRIEWSKI
ncbi:accessory gene regulator B family protein [Lysinibacillus sp. NPDC094403]|uniref:accessory gene regulator B family protein n=1 Tax=Lysinibacillus sp. NPDC094403 TaxID=3390581 RepID=UPI003CFE2673